MEDGTLNNIVFLIKTKICSQESNTITLEHKTSLMLESLTKTNTIERSLGCLGMILPAMFKEKQFGICLDISFNIGTMLVSRFKSMIDRS